MKKIISSLSLIALCTIGSCTSSNDDIKTPVDEFTIASRLKFVNINDRIAKFKDSKARITIVTWDEWGRASKQCHGWGLCNANWWPLVEGTPANGETATLLEKNVSTNRYYIDLLLAQPVPSDISVEELTFKIDQDFVLDIDQEIGKDLTFNQGNYVFESSLGDYGGYRIYLD